MKVVYKFELEIPDGPPGTHGRVTLPLGAERLKIAYQHEKYVLWCLVDPKAKTQDHRFLVLGTGHVCNPIALVGMDYVDTVITHGGSLVFHFWMSN